MLVNEIIFPVTDNIFVLKNIYKYLGHLTLLVCRLIKQVLLDSVSPL